MHKFHIHVIFIQQNKFQPMSVEYSLSTALIQFSMFAGSRYEVTCMELSFKLYMSALVKSGFHMAECL